MSDAKPRTSRWKIIRRLIYLLLAGSIFFGWRDYTYQRAVSQVCRADFRWWETNLSAAVRKNWRNLFRAESWVPARGVSGRLKNTDLSTVIDSITRINPTHLDLYGHGTVKSVAEIQNLSNLRDLDLSHCGKLRNVDALRNFKNLERLNLALSGPLESVDVLKELTTLRDLNLANCTALQDMEVLNNLTNLEILNLTFCTVPIRVDVLSRFKKLRTLYLNSDIMTPAQVAEIKAALPGTKVDVQFRSLH